MKKILVIEDNNELNEMLATILADDYHVQPAYSGTEGLLYFQQDEFDLVLLDRMLPGKDGGEVLAEIRKHSQIPVIFLTALTDQQEISQLLLAGANDYLTKPFNIDELKARIIVQLRNQAAVPVEETETSHCYKNLTLLPDTFELKKDETVVALKKKEFEIFTLLLNHPKKVYTKEMLYEEIWGEAYYGDENTINVHISNLRKKIKQLDDAEPYIATVWGIGVKLA
ncbi:response regulator transcription factor [Enterococcus sp. HY326]|uniref:response regulator transcription factor n=1 Tax=Enterococcus sp. HY326 TaxID=2971265 RepID=UPI00223F3D1E|nr:response regulator transcription factor [Enterococcus sp. HY326]